MTPLPHVLKLIRLNMARSKAFPLGSERHGYEFVAPLNETWHIDPALWQKYRDYCRVRRFWGDEEETGHLVHKPGGPDHARWMFDYDGSSSTSEETGYRFADHPFRPGEYVSIRGEDGAHTFQVVWVGPAS